MEVKVTTKRLISANPSDSVSADEPATAKLINWNNSSDRRWLVNHQHWALNNSHCVLIRPANLNPTESN